MSKIQGGYGKKEELDYLLARIKKHPIRIDEYNEFKERLTQPLSYRYIWAMNQLHQWCYRNKKQAKDVKVLDLGCWTGMLSYQLKQEGYQVLAVDNNTEFLLQTKENSEVEILKSNALELSKNVKEKYDVIIALEVIEHISPDNRVLQEIYNILNNEGTLILTTPIEKNLMAKEHVNFYDFYQLRDLFDTIGDSYKICKLHKFFKWSRPKNIWGVVYVKQ